MNVQVNTLRTEEYMKLLHSIRSCTRADQLAVLAEPVVRYHRAKKQDSAELLAEFVTKEESLSVE